MNNVIPVDFTSQKTIDEMRKEYDAEVLEYIKPEEKE